MSKVTTRKRPPKKHTRPTPTPKKSRLRGLLQESIIIDLIDDLGCSDAELEELMDCSGLSRFNKITAVSLSNRLSQQTKRVLSSEGTNEKVDELAKCIKLVGLISAIGLVTGAGGSAGLSKIISLASK
jgi:hypothetical protein